MAFTVLSSFGVARLLARLPRIATPGLVLTRAAINPPGAPTR